MNAVGIFLAAQPASPWNAVTITTAVIAGLGFVVAGGGLVLGVYNARHQSRRDFPKARWKTEWLKEDDGITFKFTNEGAGDATDVELWCYVGKEGEESWKRIKQYGVMKYGAFRTMHFSWSRPVQVRVEWRHGAKLHKVRRLSRTGKP